MSSAFFCTSCPVRGKGRELTDSSPPLVVDVDRTLLATDLLWEGLVRILVDRPHRLPYALAGLLNGRAMFKTRVMEFADLDMATLPLRREVRELIEEANNTGRDVILASAAHRSQVEALARRVGAAVALGSDERRNLKAEEKLREVLRHAEEFDYVGDSRDDLPLFRAARRSILVDPDTWTRRRVERDPGDEQVRVIQRPLVRRFRSWGRSLRPHQWAKNGLLLLPMLAAHMEWTTSLAEQAVGGLAAFSLLASAVYVGNDLADLPHDRRHPSKSDRPLAAGEMTIPAGLITVAALLAVAVMLTLRLPTAFGVTLVVYLTLNVGYSMGLKRVLVLDLVILAALYTIRIVAGAALVRIELTGWFLAFSVFLFLSLAVLKRVVELEDRQAPTREAESNASGRAYRSADLPVLHAVGPAAGVMAALVYCLYITGPVRELYDHPDLLWIGLPLFLYWIVRVWLLALRGEVDDDPVVFVLRDLSSYSVLGAFLLVVFAAA